MTDYSQLLDSVARDIQGDAHDGVRFHFLSECQKRGIIPEIPSHWFDEGRGQPFPINWTASELTIFDNGQIALPKKAEKTLRTTKTRYGGQWKAWTSVKVNFQRAAPWSHLASFFPQQEALAVVEQLVEAKFLDKTTKDLLDQVLSRGSLDASAHIGLVRRQSPKVGTIWLRGHLLILSFEGGKPSQTLLIGDNIALVAELGSDDAAGEPLTGKAVAQARMATNAAFDRWHNQTKLY